MIFKFCITVYLPISLLQLKYALQTLHPYFVRLLHFYIIITFCHLLGIVSLYLLPIFTYSILLSKLGFDSWQGREIFLFPMASRLILGTIQPTIQWITGIPFMEVKWLYSPICLHGMDLINYAQGQLYPYPAPIFRNG